MVQLRWGLPREFPMGVLRYDVVGPFLQHHVGGAAGRWNHSPCKQVVEAVPSSLSHSTI